MFRRPAKPAETFHHTCGDVRRGGIDHGVMVCEGNVTEELMVVVAVKRAPAAVAVLLTEQPLDAAANRAFHALGIGILHALEGHQHKCGIVHIGIEIVANLETPAAGFPSLVLPLPIAWPEHLL